MTRTKILPALIVGLLLVFGPISAAHATGGAAPGPLDILLTNDDGYDSPGIQALRGALLAAGHQVTIVAPLEQQSGQGGAISTAIGGFVDVVEQSPGVWSVDSTPSDAVRAGLEVVMADNPPDLIVSGANFGQNLGMTGSSASGTVNAALAGLYAGVPSIAVSVELLFSESGATPIPFPSTFAAYGPTAAFVANLIAELQRSAVHGEILPAHQMLNINVPVPYQNVAGIKYTRLAVQGNFEIVFQDVLGVIPTGGGPVLLNIDFPPPSTDTQSDTYALENDFISITPMDGDMSSKPIHRWYTAIRLRDLAP